MSTKINLEKLESNKQLKNGKMDLVKLSTLLVNVLKLLAMHAFHMIHNFHIKINVLSYGPQKQNANGVLGRLTFLEAILDNSF